MSMKRATRGCLAAGGIVFAACGAQYRCDEANECRARDEGDEVVDASSPNHVQASPTPVEPGDQPHVDIVVDSLAAFAGAASGDSQSRHYPSVDCRVPSSGNLLQNPGFDGAFDEWNSQSVLTLSADSESCAASNSVSVKATGSSTAFQCIPLTPGQYYLGGRFKGGSAVAVSLAFYSGNCGRNLHESEFLRPTPPTNSWEADSALVTVPSGADSAYFSVYTEQILYMDQLYVNGVNSF